MEMTGLHDHTSQSKNVAPASFSRVNSDLFGAKTNNPSPISQRFCSLGVDVLEINAKVIMFWAVSTIKWHIRVQVRCGDTLWIDFVWIHHCKRWVEESKYYGNKGEITFPCFSILSTASGTALEQCQRGLSHGWLRTAMGNAGSASDRDQVYRSSESRMRYCGDVGRRHLDWAPRSK